MCRCERALSFLAAATLTGFRRLGGFCGLRSVVAFAERRVRLSVADAPEDDASFWVDSPMPAPRTPQLKAVHPMNSECTASDAATPISNRRRSHRTPFDAQAYRGHRICRRRDSRLALAFLLRFARHIVKHPN